MSVRLYDSAARQVRDFVPLRPGEVGIYVCGATPQGSPHVGHLRAQVAFDVLRRWLERRGHRVTLVRNVTDIDDKILARAAEAGVPWWAHAFRYELEFARAYDTVGVLRPAYEPRATGHVTEMVELIVRLVESGHAYPSAAGDVWFDVRSWPAYGELTRQRPDGLEPAADTEDAALKRDPRDFALWKAAKAGEPATASWPTPWGRGRPGWHLECSAMATRYLGPEFDIHGGGLDLRFPHHENEQAQSRAAGDGFARYWMHNGLLVQAGEKMSKSVGNTLALDAVLGRIRPVELRYLLTAPHYRSVVEVGDEALAEAAAAYQRIEGFVHRVTERLGAVAAPDRPAQVPAAFAAAMDDDLAVPAALATVHDTVREGNRALADGDDDAALEHALEVRSMTAALGLDPLDGAWTGSPAAADTGVRAVLDGLVRAELDARAAARKERDFAAADAIRDRLAAAGVVVEDTPDGARWSLIDGR